MEPESDSVYTCYMQLLPNLSEKLFNIKEYKVTPEDYERLDSIMQKLQAQDLPSYLDAKQYCKKLDSVMRKLPAPHPQFCLDAKKDCDRMAIKAVFSSFPNKKGFYSSDIISNEELLETLLEFEDIVERSKIRSTYTQYPETNLQNPELVQKSAPFDIPKTK